MKKYRREVTVEILVGLFMFSIIIALGFFTIILSSETFWQNTYSYEFVFSEISGLREGDNVLVHGMNVGRVNQMDLKNNHVSVYVSLDQPLHLRRGYKIDVVDASMLGGKNVKIYEGPIHAPPISEDQLILGTSPIDMIAELGVAVDGLRVMIDSFNNGEGTLGKLLKDKTIHDNLAKATTDLMEIAGRLNAGEGILGKLLSKEDDPLYTDGKIMMENLRTLSQNLMDGKGILGELMNGDKKSYEDLEATLVAARSISESISNGEGTLGRLVRDAKLYDETTLLIEDVRAAVDDLREASPITSFGSVLFGAF